MVDESYQQGYEQGFQQGLKNAPKKSGHGCLIFSIIVAVLVIGGLTITGLGIIGMATSFLETTTNDLQSPSDVVSTLLAEGMEGSKKIAVIDIKGVITRGSQYSESISPESVHALLEEFRASSDIGAVILDMDSPGGEVTAADEIYSDIQKFRKEHPEVPVITCMHSMGASGGYYIASATDCIIANRLTMTGSIGVIIESYNATALMDKIGVSSAVYTSGDMKDMMSMTRPASQKEIQYIHDMVMDTFAEFAQVVAMRKNSRYPTKEDVMKAPFADGRVVSGANALELGLVDGLGGMDEAIEKAKELAKLNNPSVWHYQNKVKVLDMLLNVKAPKFFGASSLLQVPGSSLEQGRLYYIAPQCINR